MSLDKKLVDKLVNITSSASIACYKFIGKNDKISADKAATDEMRKKLNLLDIDGKVVIGEGELEGLKTPNPNSSGSKENNQNGYSYTTAIH